MPTYTVKASGGDYTTLSAAEAARNDDHVTRAEITTIECYDLEDTTAVVIDGGNSNASYYFRVVGTGAGKHAGKWTSTAYRLNVSSTQNALDVSDPFVRLEYLQVTHTDTTGSDRRCIYIPSAGNDARIDSCICRDQMTGGTYATGFYAAAATCLFINCLSYDARTGASDGHGFTTWAANTFYNCGAHNCKVGYQRQSATNTTTNCWAQGNTDAWGGTWSGDYNCTDQATEANMPGANSTENVTITFVDEGGDDFHLASGDTTARNNGTDLSGTFTNDIDGDTRSAWDIGPDEFVAASGTSYLTLLGVG